MVLNQHSWHPGTVAHLDQLLGEKGFNINTTGGMMPMVCEGKYSGSTPYDNESIHVRSTREVFGASFKKHFEDGRLGYLMEFYAYANANGSEQTHNFMEGARETGLFKEVSVVDVSYRGGASGILYVVPHSGTIENKPEQALAFLTTNLYDHMRELGLQRVVADSTDPAQSLLRYVGTHCAFSAMHATSAALWINRLAHGECESGVEKGVALTALAMVATYFAILPATLKDRISRFREEARVQ
ncbi:MAG: hypothetical protein AABX04_06735 [Nanoarchaeota archaeon]